MRTFSDYFSVIEHQNLLRMENRADPLCHDDHGAVFDILRQCFSKRRIRFQVKCRKTVVENKDFRVFCNRTRNRQTLFLTAGYVGSALFNVSVVAVRETVDKFICVSAVDGILKKEQDNPSVGLLLCKSKNDLVAEYSLKDMSKPIGVSAYQVTSKLPEELEKQLPSVEDIQKRIK